MQTIIERTVPQDAMARLMHHGVDPVLARVFASRGIRGPDELELGLDRLASYSALANAEDMGAVLADAIQAGKRLLIVGDYDADGATASAVGCLALRRLGAKIDSLVPNRFEFGYGLTPEIVRIAAQRGPDLIITVDNGIASLEGIDEARRLGIPVLVTDHHLPGAELPRAELIVNPNQAGCAFPSKSLAGVGVMFYVAMATRAQLRQRGAFAHQPEPNLGDLLDLVALGTVADVVRLDGNNRILVAHGLKRIRAGKTRPGISALARAAGRSLSRATCYELGFVLGPRINAAGRLEDMSEGIECLITVDESRAQTLAGRLDALNRERRGIESEMQTAALASLDSVGVTDGVSLVLHDAGWHAGVVGLLASRLRERFHRPVLCFASGPDGELKGSGRSIPALHLRDALDLLDRRHPGLVLRFGGHAAAAGLSILEHQLPAFRSAFERVTAELLSPADLQRVIETDGSLDPVLRTLPLAEALQNEVWGQGFAPPSFADGFRVVSQRLVGGAHMRLEVVPDDGLRAGPSMCAMLFRHDQPVPPRIHAAYRLDVNEWNGNRTVQLLVDHWHAAE